MTNAEPGSQMLASSINDLACFNFVVKQSGCHVPTDESIISGLGHLHLLVCLIDVCSEGSMINAEPSSQMRARPPPSINIFACFIFRIAESGIRMHVQNPDPR